jgi:dihydrolipoamide dehydrogenase
LLHLAKIKADAEHASDMGIHFDNVRVNTNEVGKWKNDVVKKLTGGLGQLVKARKINYICGKAKFLDSETIQIEKNGGGKKQITFENAIVATGAKPVELPGIDINSPKIMHSAESLELKDIPNKMLIVGGGYIGLEMATIYKSLGTEITIAELTDDLMPGMDKDLVKEYKKANKNTFKEILLKTRVKTIHKKGDALEVDFEDNQKKKFSKTYDKVLISVGQSPNAENIGLENTSVETDEKGFIKVNAKMQTSQKNIYAIGDVAGPPLLAHKASYEGKVAAEVIAGKKSENDAKVIPAVIYTEPEIAVCGLSEKEAKEKEVDYKVVKFPWSASGRAIAMNEKSGFTKLLVNNANERILGAGIVGRNAGDMIAEIALAVEMAANAEDLALTIHPHPTLSESIMEAAEMFYGHPAHTFMKK